MKFVIQLLGVCSLLLTRSASWSAELPSGMEWTFRNYLKNSKHVVLVCEVRIAFKQPPKTRTPKYEVHVSAAVVRPIKGKGRIGDRLHYYILCEDKPPDSALAPGDLRYLFLDEYILDEFLLGTGDGWRYQPELDAILSERRKNPKAK